MPGSIRYHADEDINHNPLIAANLRQRGIDITTSREVGLLGATDDEQLSFAKEQGRVILTHNDDFIRLHRLNPNHAGILFIRQGVFSVGEVIRGLVLIHECCEPADLSGRLESSKPFTDRGLKAAAQGFNDPMSTDAKKYKDTLNLPTTAFAMKANLNQREPQIQARWEEMGLYGRIREARKGAERPSSS